MGNRQQERKNSIEKSICKIMELENLHLGGHVIRNSKGWRDNEKELTYNWTVSLDHSFCGVLTVFCLKFASNTFREISNREELIQGILTLNEDGTIANYFVENIYHDFRDPIRDLPVFALFDVDDSITLDGMDYDVHIRARNIESCFTLRQTQSPHWALFQNHIHDIANRLSLNSLNPAFKDYWAV